MIRRLYVLLLLLATVLATLLYGVHYAQQPGVPTDDPVRSTMAKLYEFTPAEVVTQAEAYTAQLHEQLRDVRFLFLILFVLFYIQFFIRRRRAPANEREEEARRRKRKRGLLGQVQTLFIATLLVAALIFGVELLVRYGSDTMEIFGQQFRRGNAEDFRRNVYHYGLLLAVGHLIAYMLFTWMALGFAARKIKKAAARKATKA